MKYVKCVVKIVASGCRILMIATIFLLLPLFIGKKPMVVLSDSMKPTFSKGSIIYMEQVQYEDLKDGDIVSFGKNPVITHRIVEKRERTKSLLTKGDANAFADAEVPEEMLLGKVCERFYIPYAGYWMQLLRRPETIVALLLILIVDGGIEYLYEEGYRKNNIKNPLY